MKKILAIFLIVIVACETAQDLELKGIVETIDWIMKEMPKLDEAIKNAVKWFKENGYYDLLKSKIIELGKSGAVNLCSNYLSQQFCILAVMGVSQLCGFNDYWN